ncbi:hypothetical protein [Aquimarina algicola]|uniref:Collagen-like protein n=1 Tax=Aquimarina algicola TaxID=2589995 RepID=A0A504JDS8_9FLAO|nr:hypothetical protein [Aquimarina algicola]TPN88977.1 hypothetical protein FHK87_01795 [Aquimarina algicola]
MKKIFTLLLVLAAISISCEGDQGPPGPEGIPGLDGAPGEDGGLLLAANFITDPIDFVSTNGLDAAIDFPIPDNINVEEGDVPFVFILDPIASQANGADVWEPLPRVFSLAGAGFTQYRNNFIFDQATGIFDIEIILEADDFTQLGIEFTDDQVFRVIITPGEFAQNTDIDVTNFNELSKALHLVTP